jgi:hypothetical protein
VNRPESRPGGANRLAFLWLALVCLAALWTFRKALGFDFIAIDDSGNITLNPHMGPPGRWNLAWMFTDADYVRHYIPLGWLGFSIVFAASGLSAEGYHAANLAFHVANTALLFCLLRGMIRRWGTGAGPWSVSCAAIATALWALHPFRAESIGWVSGMLYGQAGFFALLSVLAYMRVGGHPAGSCARWAWLAAAAAGYLASLMTYPIAIGLFASYFVIDIADGRPLRILREKWLLVLPAASVAAATVAVRYHANSLWPAAPTLSEFSLEARIMQGFYVFAYYIWKTLAPAHLTPAPTQLFEFHPFGPAFVASAVFVAGLTAALFWRARWRGGPLLAWLAYLALVIPVAGFTEHPHFANDRYSYLPGMVMAAGLALGFARASVPGVRASISVTAVAVAAASAWAARQQLEIWRNSDSVFISIIEGTSNAIVRKQNFVQWAHASTNMGRYATARAILAERRREYPDSAMIDKLARGGEPAFDSDQALPLRDAAPEAEGNLKIALEAATAERTAEAEAHFRRSLMISPGYGAAQYNYAMFLALHGRPKEALHLYFMIPAATEPVGLKGECALLSVIARAYWDSGDSGAARSAIARALACAAGAGDAAASAAVREQARGYGAQTLPALRDSTIR